MHCHKTYFKIVVAKYQARKAGVEKARFIFFLQARLLFFSPHICVLASLATS